MTTYLVTCKHVVERHACTDREFKIGEYRHADGRVSYYASAEHYGCSKNYRTPRDAIYGMLAEHACTSIHIEELQSPRDTLEDSVFKNMP